jgi:preprotein translocase subunit SecB
MQPFPISIDRYFFTRFCVISNPDHTPSKSGLINAQVESSLNVSQPTEGGDIYIAEQRVKLTAAGSPTLPYSLDIECIGFFKVEPSLEEGKRLQMVAAVAHSVLFAATRDAVLTASARQPWGPFSIGLAILQPLNAPSAAGVSPRKTRQKVSTTVPKSKKISH